MSPRALRHRIGQLLIAGFNGEQLPVEIASLGREFGLGGVILFARNVSESEQVAELSREAAQVTPEIPAWVSVDQEGGRVARLRGAFTEWPPMATLGRSGDVGLAERFASAMAAELRAVGVTLDYAPVLDVHTNERNPVIGDRAISDNPEDVSRLGAAIIRGLQASGVAACGKHFPGHGDTSADSHVELPVVEHPPERLRKIEFPPFRAAIEAGVASIMTAHVLVPAMDEMSPATLSRRIVTDMLKDELGFAGVVLSDDLEMKALSANLAVPEAAVRAIQAGCDGVLICSGDHDTQAQALEALLHAVEDERLPLRRVDDALARQQRMKERFLATTASAGRVTGKALRQTIGCEAHRRIADEMARFA